MEYPDLTALCMHNQLIVGAGLMNPDGYIAYLGVHPEWRSSGIATQILSILAGRACLRLNEDPTIHVAVDNHPALLMYQRAGFRIEHLLKDHFTAHLELLARRLAEYRDEEDEWWEAPAVDNYYWMGEPLGYSRHAFFMRLMRVDYLKALSDCTMANK